MKPQARNLPGCPVCLNPLTESDRRCGRCGYDEVENVDFIDVSDQVWYREKLSAHRAAWAELEDSLRGQLKRFGPVWGRQENWKRIWEHLQTKAERMGIDARMTVRRAGVLWNEIEESEKRQQVGGRAENKQQEQQPPSNGINSNNIESVRQWVASLPDGEVDVRDWMRFLETLEEPVNTLFLETLRDEEINRQFSAFETLTLDAGGHVSERVRRTARQFVERLGDGVDLVLLKIPGGEFRMGSERYAFERPVHVVRIHGFYLGKFPVTQAQWRAVAGLPKVSVEMGADHSEFAGDDHPAECVSWPEAVEFCARLSQLTGRRYRLPSEAEWEYACRAGSETAFAFGETIAPQFVNYDGAYPYGGAPLGLSRARTVAAGSLGAANRFGLFDMHGNVWEWCSDQWRDNYEGAPEDGSAWLVSDSPEYRVIRGGSWANSAEVCRSSDRNRERTDAEVKLHHLGLRVAVNL